MNALVLAEYVNFIDFVGWMDCKWWISTPIRGPQDGPNVHHGLSLMSQSLIFHSSLVYERNNFCVA
jgi:hypothetical protein